VPNIQEPEALQVSTNSVTRKSEKLSFTGLICCYTKLKAYRAAVYFEQKQQFANKYSIIFVRFQVLTAASQWWWETIGWERANGQRTTSSLDTYINLDPSVARLTHPWWWRQYATLKRRSTIILHGSTTQKTALNSIIFVTSKGLQQAIKFNLKRRSSDWALLYAFLKMRSRTDWRWFIMINATIVKWTG
jgi:hypothetical protein